MKKNLLIALVLALMFALPVNAAKPPAIKLSQQTATFSKGTQSQILQPPQGQRQRDILNTYLVEDFENDFPPTGWTIESTVPAYTWTQDSYRPYLGSYAAYCPYNYGQNERFVSPAMDFTGATPDLRVEFWWQADYTWMVAPFDNGDYELWISIDGGTTWSPKLWDEGLAGLFYYPVWYKATVDLGAYIGESNVKLSWLYVANDANDVLLDYVVVTDDPPPPPPPNDNCVDVTPVLLTTDSTITFTGDNTNATSDCELLFYPEVWHAFTITECMNVTIDFCGTDPAFGSAYMTISDACPCSHLISPFDNNNSDCEDGNWTIKFRGLLPGTYYYPVMNDPTTYTVGPYVLNVRAEACPPRPENDDCADVTPSPLSTGTMLTFSGTNLSSTNDCDNMIQDQVWHAFTTTETMDVKIDYCGTDPVFHSVWGSLNDNCPCGSFLDYTIAEDTSCGDGNYAIYWYNVPPGTYYYPVAVDYWAGAEGPYTIHIVGAESLPAPENDLCGNALPIGPVQNQPFSTLRASYDNLGDCISTKDIWYVFAAPISGSATVTTCGSDYNTKLAIYDGAGCDPLAELLTCDDDDYDHDCGEASRSIFNITEGNSYLIQVGGGAWDKFGDGLITVEYGNSVIGVYPTSISGEALIEQSDSDTLYISNSGTATLNFALSINQHPFLSPPALSGLSARMASGRHQLGGNGETAGLAMDIRPGFESHKNKPISRPFPDTGGRVVLEGGEDIASAMVITSFPYTDIGSTENHADDYNENCPFESTAPDVVYSYTPTAPGSVSISLCGSDYDTKMFVYDDSYTPGSPYACNDDGCGSDGYRSIIPSMEVVAGHTYYIVIDGWGSSSGSYEFVLDEPIEPPANDDCVDAIQIDGPFPTTVYGNNLGASVDCPGYYDIYAVWYKVDVPYIHNRLDIDYCGSDGSIFSIFGRIFMDCGDCGSSVYRNSIEWVDCPGGETNPLLHWLSLPGPATYYIPVFFGGATFDFGMTVDVTEVIPCEFTCPPEAIAENEECGDDVNGGCGDEENPGGFEAVSPNTTICGTAWADDGYRDTDWYSLTLTEPNVVTITGRAEFPFQMLVIDPGPEESCDDNNTINGVQTVPCSLATMVTILPAGEWYIWAGPSEGRNAPCGGTGIYYNEYYFTISCQLSWLALDVADGSIAPGGPTAPVAVIMGAAGLAEGDYTADILIYSDDPDNSEITIPVTFEVSNSQLSQYLPGDANMHNGTWPPAVIGSDVTYLVNYFRAIPTNPACIVDGFYCSADVNADCRVIGSDVTRLVSYFRSIATINYCPDYEPAWLSPADCPEEAPAGWPNCETSPLLGKTIKKENSIK